MRSPRVSSTVQDRSIQNLQVGTSQGIRNGIADRSRSSKTNKQGQEGIDWPTLLTNWPWYTSKTHRITWSLEMKWLMLQLNFYGNVTISVRGYSDTASVSLSIVTSPYCLTAPNAGRASLEFALTPSRQPNTSWQLEPILPRRSYWIELASQHTPSLQACVMGDWLWGSRLLQHPTGWNGLRAWTFAQATTHVRALQVSQSPHKASNPPLLHPKDPPHISIPTQFWTEARCTQIHPLLQRVTQLPALVHGCILVELAFGMRPFHPSQLFQSLLPDSLRNGIWASTPMMPSSNCHPWTCYMRSPSYHYLNRATCC